MKKIFLTFLIALILFLAPGPGFSIPTAQEQKLQVGLKESPPFTYKNSKGEWEGLSVYLWENVAKELGLQYQYEEATLPVLFARLKDRQFDIVIGALTVTPERETYMDYTHSLYSSGLGIVSQQRSTSLISSILDGILSYDFLKSIMILFLILFLAGSALWLFERKRNPEQFGGKPAEGLGNGLWWSAVTMTTVGYGDKAPITFGGRIIAIIWMFASIMLISGLTATIAASLTVRNLEPGIRDFSDLPGKVIGTLEASSSDNFLKNEGFRKIRYYADIPAALEALQKLEVDAVVYDSPILRYYINAGEAASRLSLVDGNSARQQYAFALPEDSDLLEAINQKLLEEIFKPSWTATLDKYILRKSEK